jgi:hypothetical protein
MSKTHPSQALSRPGSAFDASTTGQFANPTEKITGKQGRTLAALFFSILAATQNRPEAIGIGPAVVAAPDRIQRQAGDEMAAEAGDGESVEASASDWEGAPTNIHSDPDYLL